ncbi:MAG TPA: glycosyltransferase [Candidatus Limnocylindria bacterium]
MAASGGADPRGNRVLSLILPAYNEARRLPASLARCAEYFRARGMAAEIIVVDDGSTDSTATAYAGAVESLPRTQLQYRFLELAHSGKGAAVRSGVAAAAGDPIVFLDTDLTIPVETIDAFMGALADGADIVVASRYVPGSIVERPWWRVAMGTVYRACVHLIVPIDVNDTQCGGKMYTAEAAKDLFGRATLGGFAFDAEVLYIARRRGYRVAETPVQIHQLGRTSVSFLRDTPTMLRDLFRIRWNGLRGRYR